MRYVDLTPGLEYGLRFRLSSTERLHRVVVVEKLDRNKQVKVRHLEGEQEGMEEFISFRNVVVAWKARKRFLRNEEKLRTIRELSSGADPVVREAVQAVFGAAGEHSAFVHSDGHFSADVAAVERLAARAGIEGPWKQLDSCAFVDDNGWAQLGFAAAHRLAIELAKREPDTITIEVESREEELRAGGYAMGERWQHEWLRDQRPAFALMRQWAGFSRDLDRLQKEIERLRGLAYGASLDLERAGKQREARRLQRALDGK
ncbi:MAG: hypothetical protein AB7N24_15425 [Dehalococcoidia bacterium]